MATSASHIFDHPFALIGMVHLLPLPGSPNYGGSMAEVLDRASRDAESLMRGGCHALIVENMGDVPYLAAQVEPETTAAMAVATQHVVQLGLPTGVQVLAGANQEALGAAVAAGAHFIRAEAFAYAHVADEGLLNASAGPLLRKRAYLKAEVAVWADIKKKHASHAVTGDLSLLDVARGSIFCGADALVVTGEETGQSAQVSDLESVQACAVPSIVGSGVTAANVSDYLSVARGAIVGSALKYGGDWRASVDEEAVRRLRQAIESGLP